MQAMILAAGLGTRMLPLTNTIPKALAIFKNKPLIEHLIINLKNNGINHIVINLHHLGEQIKQYLKTGHQYGVSISYSEETTLLDTGGGIVQALTKGLLKQEPFIVISTDIITDFNFKSLFSKLVKLAHLILVSNPKYHPNGDFSLNNNNLKLPLADTNLNYTYANIGIFDPKFFNNPPSGSIFPLVTIIKQAIINQTITGEIYNGLWKNIGTITELTTSIN